MMKKKIVYQLGTSVDDPWHWLVDICPLSFDSSSDACFELAKSWLQNCLKNHKSCANKKALLPTRVIDVGNAKREPLLHITGGEQYGRWLTLSHCWGSYHTLVTTQSNLEAHRQSIRLLHMPETYRDAIEITRRLGYMYLWIDSLCIIQDSEYDWRNEGGKMADTYMNAILNISADASEGDNAGIFKSVAKERETPGQLALSYPSNVDPQSKAGTIYATMYEKRLADKHILHHRGWVLQEARLSPRLLRYVGSGLHWFCGEATAEEKSPRHTGLMHGQVPLSIHARKFERIPTLQPYSPTFCLWDELGREKYTEKFYQLYWWYKNVCEFVNRELSFPKDRIPAIVGLGKAFSERTGYTFLCGMMLEDMLRGVLWKGVTGEAYFAHYPSWSWTVAERSSGEIYYQPNTIWPGRFFNAQLVAINLDHGFEGTTKTFGTLSLRGYTRTFESFRAEIGAKMFRLTLEDRSASFKLLSSNDEPSLVPESLIKLAWTINQEGRHEFTTHTIWLDKPLVPAEVQIWLLERQAIALRITTFEGDMNTCTSWPTIWKT